MSVSNGYHEPGESSTHAHYSLLFFNTQLKKRVETR
jgi:hypothetical protein